MVTLSWILYALLILCIFLDLQQPPNFNRHFLLATKKKHEICLCWAFFNFLSELCLGKVMVAYTQSLNNGRKRTAKGDEEREIRSSLLMLKFEL